MTARRRRSGAGRDAGSSSVELVVLVPALLGFVALVLTGGRLALATQAVEHAAATAARAASSARAAGEAGPAATDVARTTLADSPCGSTSTTVAAGGFAAAPGVPATVTATVTCTVALSDLGVPGVPGSHVISRSATSPLDTYRERT
ncbi:MAG: TadE/TadG family type IV pilus assembly protein [Kineosporiaceae bacterium]